MMKMQARKAIATLGGAAALTILSGCGAQMPASGAPAAPTVPTTSSPAPPPPAPPSPAPPPGSQGQVPASGCVVGANC